MIPADPTPTESLKQVKSFDAAAARGNTVFERKKNDRRSIDLSATRDAARPTDAFVQPSPATTKKLEFWEC